MLVLKQYKTYLVWEGHFSSFSYFLPLHLPSLGCRPSFYPVSPPYHLGLHHTQAQSSARKPSTVFENSLKSHNPIPKSGQSEIIHKLYHNSTRIVHKSYRNCMEIV